MDHPLLLNKLLSIDADSLHDNHRVVITLSCRESENEVVQTATAIVQEGDRDGYEYLLKNCKRHPEMREFLTSAQTTCFSAGDPDARAALAAEAPQAQHRWCLDDITSNIPVISAVRDGLSFVGCHKYSWCGMRS